MANGLPGRAPQVVPDWIKEKAAEDVVAVLAARYGVTVAGLVFDGDPQGPTLAEYKGKAATFHSAKNDMKHLARKLGIRSGDPPWEEVHGWIRRVLSVLYTQAVAARYNEREALIAAAGIPAHARNGF